MSRSNAAAAVSQPVPRPVATNQPTPEFRQHHTVETPQVDSTAFRQGWRVQTRLDALLEAGRIDREQFEAAQIWRHWAEAIASTKVQSWDVRVDASFLANDSNMLARVQTATKLRSVADALGPLRVHLLQFCVIDDRSWRQIGDRLRINSKTAQIWTIATILALSKFLAGEPMPDPPQLRPRIQPGSW